MDYTDGFMLYFITRLPNPLFSPELQAKTTLVDFTVTQKGLEEQLLGRVISKEQKALEEQLNEVLEAVNSATKLKLELDAALLQQMRDEGGMALEEVPRSHHHPDFRTLSIRLYIGSPVAGVSGAAATPPARARPSAPREPRRARATSAANELASSPPHARLWKPARAQTNRSC